MPDPTPDLRREPSVVCRLGAADTSQRLRSPRALRRAAGVPALLAAILLAGCGGKAPAPLVQAPAGRSSASLTSPPTGAGLRAAALTFRYARSPLTTAYDPKLAWAFVTPECKRNLTFAEFTRFDDVKPASRDSASTLPSFDVSVKSAHQGEVQIGGPDGPIDHWVYEHGGWRVKDPLCSLSRSSDG